MLLIRKVRRRKSGPLTGWVIRGLKDTDNTMKNTINLEENQAIIDVDAIITAEKCRMKPRLVELL